MKNRQKEKNNILAEIEKMTREDMLSHVYEEYYRQQVLEALRKEEERKKRIKEENNRKLQVIMNYIVVIQKVFRGRIGRLKGRRFDSCQSHSYSLT